MAASDDCLCFAALHAARSGLAFATTGDVMDTKLPCDGVFVFSQVDAPETTLTAGSVFGALRGLETLSQLLERVEPPAEPPPMRPGAAAQVLIALNPEQSPGLARIPCSKWLSRMRKLRCS